MEENKKYNQKDIGEVFRFIKDIKDQQILESFINYANSCLRLLRENENRKSIVNKTFTNMEKAEIDFDDLEERIIKIIEENDKGSGVNSEIILNNLESQNEQKYLDYVLTKLINDVKIYKYTYSEYKAY